jgi:hypothetical protein
MKRFITLAAAFLALALFSACEDKDGALRWHSRDNTSSASSSSSLRNADIVGTWTLSTGTSSWYIHFAKEGTWFISDDKGGSARRVYGTYTTDGKNFSGPMVNPGVGTGRISGKIDGNLISLDFVEDWHTPSKHVAYTGEKL